jgi:hypothetical protein
VRALGLSTTELEGLFSTAAGRILQVPHSPDFIALLCDIARDKPVLIPVLIGGLGRVPDAGLPVSVPNRISVLAELFPDHRASIVGFLRQLKRSSNAKVALAARQALDRLAEGA